MNRNKLNYHKKNKITRVRIYIEDFIEREMEKDFNCVHGIITGVTMALMFIGALFL